MLRTPPKYLINEAKFNTITRSRTPNQWKNTLSNTKAGRQIGDDWVEIKLREMFDEYEALDIIRNNEKILTGISNNGNTIEIFQLSQNSTSITKTRL